MNTATATATDTDTEVMEGIIYDYAATHKRYYRNGSTVQPSSEPVPTFTDPFDNIEVGDEALWKAPHKMTRVVGFENAYFQILEWARLDGTDKVQLWTYNGDFIYGRWTADEKRAIVVGYCDDRLLLFTHELDWRAPKWTIGLVPPKGVSVRELHDWMIKTVRGTPSTQ